MAKSCLVASLVTCQNLMVILARLRLGYHGQILHGSITCQNLMVIFAIFWSGHHGQILRGSITCRNLMVILARFRSGHHGQILPGSITSDLSEPYGNLGKIEVSSPWPNLTW